MVFSSASLAYANEPKVEPVPQIRQIVKSPCTLKPKDEDIGFEVSQIDGHITLDFDKTPNAKIGEPYMERDNLLVTEGNIPDGYFESIMKKAGAGEYIFEIKERSPKNEKWVTFADKCFLRSVKDEKGNVKFFLTERKDNNGDKLDSYDFISGYYFYPGGTAFSPSEKVTIRKRCVGDSTYFDKDLKFNFKILYVLPGSTEDKSTEVESSVNDPAKIELPIGTKFVVRERNIPKGYDYRGGQAYDYTYESEKFDLPYDVEGFVFPEEEYNTIYINNGYKEVSLTGLTIDNLPFIVMICVPIIVGAGWVVRKRFA